MSYLRSITFYLCEEDRSCCHCGKRLAGQDETIFMLSPSANKAFEFCSWYCLYKFVTKLLKDKVAAARLLKTDLLKKLGCNLRWGVKLAKGYLEKPITDPIEDRQEGKD